MRKFFYLLPILIFGLTACSEEGSSASDLGAGSGSLGKSGSLARFTIIDEHLYIVDERKLKVFSLINPENAIYLSDQLVGADVETVFPYNKNTLFIGTTSGMYIYDVSNPSNIQLLSTYEHVVACDPVVADSNHAYVTLRSDRNSQFCRRSVNQLDIVDIQDLRNPKLVNEVAMVNPRGLGLYGDTLLVCDAGVKSYDISSPMSPQLLDADDSFSPFDIIANGDLMIVVSATGLRQYRFSKGKLNFLSDI